MSNKKFIIKPFGPEDLLSSTQRTIADDMFKEAESNLAKQNSANEPQESLPEIFAMPESETSE